MASSAEQTPTSSSTMGKPKRTETKDSKTAIVADDHDDSKFAIVVRKANPVWVKQLYSVNLLTVEELTQIYDSIRYIGFNRELMMYKLETLVPDQKIAIQIIIACALRGPQAASKLKMRNGRTISEMGIPGSGKMGTEDLSCQRIASSTADLAAFYLKMLNVPKRINSLECPAWLQFPTAGSIKLPEVLRTAHKRFSMEFSALIGGTFREDIYQQMVDYSYLDEQLNLF